MSIVSGGMAGITFVRHLSGKMMPEKVYRVLVVWALFLFLWEGSLYAGIFKSMLLAPPTAVLEKTFYFLEKGYLQINIAASLSRFLAGFAIAIIVAVPSGIAFGLSRGLYEWLSPVLNFIRMIPPPAMLPFVIILLGIGETPAVFVIAIGCFFPVFMNTMRGVREVETIHVEVVQTMGGGRADLLRHVIIPSAMPTILTGVRIGFGIGWLVLVCAEVVAADSGLGFMIEGARLLLETPTVFVGMATICVLGLTMDILLKRVEKFFILRNGGGYLNYREG